MTAGQHAGAGRAAYDAERDVIRTAAVQARQALERPAWHGRLGHLLDALPGVQLSPDRERFLRFLAAGEWSTREAIALFAELRRGAYPAIEEGDPPTVQGELVPPNQSAGLVPGSAGPYRPDPVEEA